MIKTPVNRCNSATHHLNCVLYSGVRSPVMMWLTGCAPALHSGFERLLLLLLCVQSTKMILKFRETHISNLEARLKKAGNGDLESQTVVSKFYALLSLFLAWWNCGCFVFGKFRASPSAVWILCISALQCEGTPSDGRVFFSLRSERMFWFAV